MATTVARLEAILSADTRDFDRAMDRSDSRAKGMAKTLGKAGLAGAVVGLGFAVKAGFSEFMEAQRVTAQTNAVIKSTAGVANVSAGEVDKLASSLMRKSGVDDEVIASGENMLLTFTKIRNETGAGNKIFDEATKATLNLSVAMGKDMQSSAVLVGKALNDPIKGIGALSRVGVQLDADQKNLIKTMVAAGNTMGAQKVILKELETQFGGSAEAAGKTFGGQINIAKQTLANLSGEVVAKLIPVLTQFINYISGTVVPAVRDGFAWIQKIFRDNEEQIREIIGGVQQVLRGIGIVLREVVLPAARFVFAEVMPRVIGTVIEVIAGITVAIRKVATFITESAVPAFEKAFAGISDAIGPVVSALAKIVDSVEWLIKNVGRIPKFGFGSSAADVGFPSGDAHSPNYAGLNLMGASPVMAPFAAAAAGYGLQVTSGLRPGAITANGTPSDHGIGKALDLAGSASAMAGFFMSLIGNRAVKQAFYDPRGSIFGGAWSSYREGGHSDHVHVATYDKGGFLQPGWNMAYNGTGRPEPVGHGLGATINVYGSVVHERELLEWLRNGLIKVGQRNGGGAIGGLA